MTIQEFFKLGMDREIPELLDFPPGLALNLGAGNKIIPDTVSLDLPYWDANKDKFPYGDGTVSGIHCYHFLEHVDKPIEVLAECHRVLKVGGVLNVVVPWYRSQLAFHDLNHKTFWTEETWKTLFWCRYYYASGFRWCWHLHANFIIGIKEENLALFTQLQKE